MIPLREQEVIRRRFEQELAGRVRIDYFTQRQTRVIVPGREDCAHCEDVHAILQEIAHLSERISLTERELASEPQLAAELGIDKVPGIAIRGQANRPVRFAGIPSGMQFPGFIDTIIDASRPSVDLAPETSRQFKRLKQDVTLTVFVTPTCANSPATARLAFKLGLSSARIGCGVVEIAEFPALAQRLGVTATPATLIDDKLMLVGALTEGTLMQAILKVVEGKPISAEDFKPGPSTALPVAAQQSPREAISAGGIILPR